jgi:asparagine synthase (glutamine-hydrolysing)
VRQHMVADVPVGLFLSACVDSSVITCLARELYQDLLAITLGVDQYRGTSNDGVADAIALAGRLGVAHQVSWLDKEDFLTAANTIIKAMDLRPIDGAKTYFVAKAAAAAGLKVALSGLGDDELFSGYPTFAHIPQIVGLTRPFERMPLLGVAFRRLTAPIVSRLYPPNTRPLRERRTRWRSGYLLWISYLRDCCRC